MEALLSVFLLPSLAGYLVLAKTKFYSVSTHAYSMTKLLADSLLKGLFLLYLSYIFLSLVQLNIPTFLWDSGNTLLDNLEANVLVMWHSFIWPLRHEAFLKPNHFSTEAIFSYVIALGYVGIEYLLVRFKNKNHNRAIVNERLKIGGAVERMFVLSLSTQKSLQITLKNRKIYIGFLMDLPELSPSNKFQRFINIFPLLSTYRNADTLSVSHQMTDYALLLELLVLHRDRLNGGTLANNLPPRTAALFNNLDEITLRNLEMGLAIDCEEIISIQLWDNNIFDEFERQRRNAPIIAPLIVP